MTNYTPSHSCLIQAMPNSKIYSAVSHIPLNKVALVVLGGGVTTDTKRAAGYIEHIAPMLKSADIKNMNIYSAVYSFGSLDSDLLKINLFRRAGRIVKIKADNAAQQEQKLKQINKNEPVPEYVLDLYDDLIEPRIVVGDVAATTKNMRNLVFYNHCHGAVALRLLADVTCAELKKAEFDDTSIHTILKNIVAIQHNPVGPLEKSPVTAVNFISASDDVLDYHDQFSEQVMGTHNLAPSFLGEQYGNIFVAGKLKVQHGAEHGFSDGYKNDSEVYLTENGKIIFRAEQNAIKNAISAAQNNAPIPNVQQLVSGSTVDFATIKSNGDMLSNTMMTATKNHQK